MLLEIKNLSINYKRRKTIIPAVRNVSLNLETGETLGIVGESGCGKSSLALSILKLISSQEGKISGNVLFEGNSLLDFSEEQIREIRGNKIGFIFQDPFSSLNPVLRLGDQIAESIRIHQPQLSDDQIRNKVMESLREVRLEDPERIYDSFPHQVSGGQRQRIMIAIAIANKPKLLIADEPTTALDVTIQKEILDLLNLLQKELDMAIILVTHHFGIIAQYTQKLIVLYGGEIVEQGNTSEIIRHPQHPYTQALLKGVPGGRMTGVPGRGENLKTKGKRQHLYTIQGSPPNLTQLPTGCIFHPRCPFVIDRCKTEVPLLRSIEKNRKVSCHLAPF